mmetsp:Transcript_153909/g.268214  ORF Transcript_153909/g.268214 Transcript_153909/m.268214 type:complete len:295 (-) Transcript_153909:68-952(-)
MFFGDVKFPWLPTLTHEEHDITKLVWHELAEALKGMSFEIAKSDSLIVKVCDVGNMNGEATLFRARGHLYPGKPALHSDLSFIIKLQAVTGCTETGGELVCSNVDFSDRYDGCHLEIQMEDGISPGTLDVLSQELKTLVKVELQKLADNIKAELLDRGLDKAKQCAAHFEMTFQDFYMCKFKLPATIVQIHPIGPKVEEHNLISCTNLAGKVLAELTMHDVEKPEDFWRRLSAATSVPVPSLKVVLPNGALLTAESFESMPESLLAQLHSSEASSKNILAPTTEQPGHSGMVLV